jgi:hypothetical protein
VAVPFGTNVAALVATFTTTGVSVTVGGVAQVSGTTPNNFTSSVVYRVTAEDSLTADYTVTVTIAPPDYAGSWRGTLCLYGTTTPFCDVILVLDETNYRIEFYTYPGGTTLLTSSTRGTHGILNPNVSCTLNKTKTYFQTNWIDTPGTEYMQYSISDNSMHFLYDPNFPQYGWVVEANCIKQ